MKRTLLALFLILPLPALADEQADRLAAAKRYAATAGIGEMAQELTESFAAQLPPEDRAEFKQTMSGMIRVEHLEAITLNSMMKHFTTEELNALADFYGSPTGQSILGKFGAYTAEVMPLLMDELVKAAEQAQAELDG